MLNTANKPLSSLDFMKFLMAICVIAIHTHPLEGITSDAIKIIYSEFVNLAVPFFFMSNGYLLFRNRNTNNKKEMLQSIKKFGIKMLKLYVIWNFIYLPFAVFGYLLSKESVIKSIILYIRNFIFIGEHHLSWPLWYLLSAIYASAFIYFIIYKFGLNKKLLIWSAAAFFCLDIFFTYIVSNETSLKWGGGNTSLKYSSKNYTEWQNTTGAVLYPCWRSHSKFKNVA